MKLTVTILIFLLSSTIYAQLFKPGQAQGLFMSIGVGPKIPVGDFSDSHNIGVGFDMTFSYTDNEIAPIFLYAKIGYQHYPGRQTFYKTTEHSSISSNVIFVNPGLRIYLPPIIDQDFILMPVVEGGLSWAYFDQFHQFKVDSGLSNFTDESTKYGFHVGGGFSMFLMDVMICYNYFHDHQYISFDLRIRIPIFVKV